MIFKCRKKHLILFILLLGCFSLYVWGHYMRATWDNHIVSGLPVKIGLKTFKEEDKESAFGGEWKELSEANEPDLFQKYNHALEIVKIDGTYIWRSNQNKKLKKFIKKSTPHEGLLTARQYVEQEHTIFQTVDKTETITIPSSKIIENGCLEYSVGNIKIRYDLNNTQYVISSVNAPVYENILQYFLCH